MERFDAISYSALHTCIRTLVWQRATLPVTWKCVGTRKLNNSLLHKASSASDQPRLKLGIPFGRTLGAVLQTGTRQKWLVKSTLAS